MSGFYTWDKTAAANASSDTFTWAEGMAPSAVNNSARGMMASAAKWRDDISGSLLTTGTSTAYAIASNQTFDTIAHLDGMMIAFTPHETNGATVTLNVDGLGAKPLRSAPGVELSAATLIEGSPYVATYYNASGEFILHGFHQLPEVIPVGGCIPYLGTTVPNPNFAFPYGQLFSRTTYSKLFALIGTTFGAGDGSTTFKGPDVRGRAFFGLDNMGGTAAGRITTAGGGVDGSILGATGGAQSQTLTQSHLPNVNFTVTIPAGQGSHNHGVSGGTLGGTGAGAFNEGSFQTTPVGPSAIGIVANSLPAMSGTAASGGSGTAHSIVPPAFICPVIMRIA